MSWRPVRRNPCERDVRIEHHADELRVELLRGGRLQAVRRYPEHECRKATDLAFRWMALGPAIFVLERFDVRCDDAVAVEDGVPF